MWHRVFAANEIVPELAGIQQCLARSGFDVTTSCDQTPESVWFSVTLDYLTHRLTVERFESSEAGIRAELNCWAANLEEWGTSPQHIRLMERTIQSRQLFTLEQPDEAGVEVGRLCRRLCQYLAVVTEGFYQTDGEGLYAADGTLLVSEGA